MHERTCSVSGCHNPTRSRSAELCKKHYHRQYRHGSVDRVAHRAGISVSHGRRYRSLYLPRHPLAVKSGKVYEHRAVLYDSIGPGPHACRWCSTTVHWDPTDGRPLQVDHLNGLGDDNRPANLVPSCGACNTARALQARSAALREAGFWSCRDTIAGLRTGGRRELLPVVTDGDGPGSVTDLVVRTVPGDQLARVELSGGGQCLAGQVVDQGPTPRWDARSRTAGEGNFGLYGIQDSRS